MYFQKIAYNLQKSIFIKLNNNEKKNLYLITLAVSNNKKMSFFNENKIKHNYCLIFLLRNVLRYRSLSMHSCYITPHAAYYKVEKMEERRIYILRKSLVGKA